MNIIILISQLWEFHSCVLSNLYIHWVLMLYYTIWKYFFSLRLLSKPNMFLHYITTLYNTQIWWKHQGASIGHSGYLQIRVWLADNIYTLIKNHGTLAYWHLPQVFNDSMLLCFTYYNLILYGICKWYREKKYRKRLFP